MSLSIAKQPKFFKFSPEQFTTVAKKVTFLLFLPFYLTWNAIFISFLPLKSLFKSYLCFKNLTFSHLRWTFIAATTHIYMTITHTHTLPPFVVGIEPRASHMLGSTCPALYHWVTATSSHILCHSLLNYMKYLWNFCVFKYIVNITIIWMEQCLMF